MTKKATAKLTKGPWILWIVYTLVMLGIGIFWWRMNGASPKQVFQDMIETNLRSRTVTKRVEQTGQEQKLDQTIYLTTGSVHAAYARAELRQSDGVATTIKTESAGTPYKDFVRYTDIVTEQRHPSGKPLDFKDAIGKWGGSERATPGAPLTDGELYGQMVLGVVPTSYLPYKVRRAVANEFMEQNVYEVDFDSTKRETQNGRPQYVYRVEMQTEQYIRVLKQFAREVGLEQLEEFNPDDYKDSPALVFDFVVDIWSRQLQEVRFVGSGRTEKFSNYGTEIDITIPESAISLDELQQQLERAAQ
jgi:hypothetical protein